MSDAFQYNAFQYDAFQADFAVISDSSNISSGATTSTTAQLSAPAGKSTANFSAGRISDDTNPLPSITIAPGNYTELEFALRFTNVSAGDEIEFRISGLSVYEVIAKLVIEAAGDPGLTIEKNEFVWASDYSNISLSTPEVSIFDTSTVNEFTYLSVDVVTAVYSESSLTEYYITAVSGLFVWASNTVVLSEYVAAGIPYLYGDAYSESAVYEYSDVYVSAPSAELDLEVYIYSQAELYDIDATGSILIEPKVYSAAILDEYVYGYISVLLDVYSSVLHEEIVSGYIGIYVSSEEDILTIGIVDAASSSLLADAYAVVDVAEYQLVSIDVDRIDSHDAAYISEYCAAVVSSLLADTYDSTIIDEYTDAYLITDITLNASGYVSLLDTIASSISIGANTVETVAADDYAVSLLYCLIYRHSDITCDDIADILTEIFIHSYYTVVPQDYCEVIRDHSADLYDNIQIIDHINCAIEDCICSTYDYISCAELINTNLLQAAAVDISGYTSVIVSEYTEHEVSNLTAAPFETIACNEYALAFWIQASGILIVDVDIIIPFVDCDAMMPYIENSVRIPDSICDLTVPETGVFIAAPSILAEEV